MKKPGSILKPHPDSKEPALAAGGLTAGGALVYVLIVRYFDADPEVALGLGMILGPIVSATATRLIAYAPATVESLLAAARSGEGKKRRAAG